MRIDLTHATRDLIIGTRNELTHSSALVQI
jgi:hypothetical protein